MKSQGGYLLHIDGTCEGDSPQLMSTIDEISNIVLDNEKMPTENTKEIIQFFERIKNAYGDPLALISDMSSKIINAVKTVFPVTLHFICHFHFLRDIGKDLFDYENITLRRGIINFRLKGKIRSAANEVKSIILNDPKLPEFVIKNAHYKLSSNFLSTAFNIFS